MKKCLLILIVLITSMMAMAQLPGSERRKATATSVQRTYQYRPEGMAFVCVNGTNRFTRALYGSHTAYRLETSDRPEFVVTDGKNSRNLRFYLNIGGTSVPLYSLDYCKASYEDGHRDYLLKDKRLGQGRLSISTLAFADREGGIWRIKGEELPMNTTVEVRLYNTKARKLSRNGDMGKFEKEGYFDAAGPCLQTVKANLKKGEHVAIQRDSLMVLNNREGEREYRKALDQCQKLSSTVTFTTPDPYLNPIGGAIVMAADGAWDGRVWNHGAVGWRMPLPGWRGAYMGDFLGMFDRQKIHFDAYAKSQVTDIPVTKPHLMDEKNNLARGAYEWGTPLYSDGYICRNPENNHQMHHYDMNLIYIDELMWHFQFDADTAYMRKMWPVIKRHLLWEKNTFDPDGDHLYDAYCCIWASDALQYNSGAVTHSSAYNYRGNLLAARIAEILDEDPTPYKNEADAILKAMYERLWLKEEGHWAEFQDFMGNRLVHKDAAVWSIYTPIDCGVCTSEQAYTCTRYIDEHIPHIAFEADGEKYETISTSDWQPYEWSINNVAMAEVMHTALAYYQAGRTDEAYRLLKGTVLDFMYMGHSPANFGQLSMLDAVTGEGYRDFADATGIASRTLVEGLFGITPQALENKCIIRPGFPSDWNSAAIHTPYIDYSFERKDGKDIYTIHQHFKRPLQIVIRQNLGDGQYKDYAFDDREVQTITTLPPPSSLTPRPPRKGGGCHPVRGGSCHPGGLRKIEDGTEELDIQSDFDEVDSTNCRAVDIDGYYNAKVTDIFQNKYISPRSPYTTLCLPTQGIGDWCSTKRTAEIDDSGLRGASENGVFRAVGVPFRTPKEGKNVVFTSLWDNYPDSVNMPIKGYATHVYLMMAGSTNPMQSHTDNAIVYVTYQDGTRDSLLLRNPDNWCPIEQDYMNDGRAFRLPEPRPYRVSLKEGCISRTLAHDMNIGSYTQASDIPSDKRPIYAIKGGAAELLDLRVNPRKQLHSLTVKTLANDVVVGLMAVTVQVAVGHC